MYYIPAKRGIDCRLGAWRVSGENCEENYINTRDLVVQMKSFISSRHANAVTKRGSVTHRLSYCRSAAPFDVYHLIAF